MRQWPNRCHDTQERSELRAVVARESARLELANVANYRTFRETLCDEMFGVSTATAPPEGADVRFRFAASPLGTLSIVDNHSAEPIQVERTQQRIAADRAPPMWVVGLCLDGMEVTTTASGTELTPAGHVRLLDTHLAHVGTTPPGTRVGMLSIPDAVARSIVDTQGWGPQAIPQSPIARVLASYLTSLFDELPGLPQSAIDQIVPSVLPLLDAALTPSSDALARTQRSMRVMRRRHVIKFIETHLGDPQLRPAWIAASLGISPRYLHALFEDQALSIGETILALRLERCRAAILDSRYAMLSITDIAFRFGFSSSSHFSRAFRRRSGVAPRELRRPVKP